MILEYGKYQGKCSHTVQCTSFLQNYKIQAARLIIASHSHFRFHTSDICLVTSATASLNYTTVRLLNSIKFVSQIVKSQSLLEFCSA